MKTNLMRRLLKPYNITIITMMMSFVAWLLPFNGRKGFILRESMSFYTVLVIILWYGLIYFSTRLGFSIGLKVPKINCLEVINEKKAYHYITVVAFIGVFFTYSSIFAINNSVIVLIFSNKDSANLLKYILYQNYSSGLFTFRYASIISGGIALYHILMKKIAVLDIINLIFLLGTAFISSRMSVLISLLLGFSMYIKDIKYISLKKILIVLSLLFMLLTVLNYYRNRSYYISNYNIKNPVLMNISEILTYLGAPFQVSVGVANQFLLGIDPSINKSEALVLMSEPSFLQKGENIVFNDNWYRNYVDVDNTLTTNSAFASLYGALGQLSFIYISWVVFIFGLLSSWLSKYKSITFLGGYIIIYCYAELWRIFLFNQGIIIFLILLILLMALVPNFIIKIKKPSLTRRILLRHDIMTSYNGLKK